MVPAHHRDPRGLGCLGALPARRRSAAAAPSILRAAAPLRRPGRREGSPCFRGREFFVVLLEPIKCPINVVQRCQGGGKSKGAARPTYSPDPAAARRWGRSADFLGKDLLEACLRALYRAAADGGSGLGVVGATEKNIPHPFAHHPNHLLPSWTELRTLIGHVVQMSRVTVNYGLEPQV